MSSPGSDPVRRRVWLPATPARVWVALTDSRELSAWFGADVSLDLRPGGRATFRWPDGHQRGAVLEEVEPPSLLSFRWLPFERSPSGRARLAPPTRVELRLEPAEGGAALTLVERRAGVTAVREAALG
jgi:uncharacterized protein YndB with AHSA1/START domain